MGFFNICTNLRNFLFHPSKVGRSSPFVVSCGVSTEKCPVSWVFLSLIHGFRANSLNSPKSLFRRSHNTVMLLLQFLSARNQSGKVTLGDLLPVMVKLKPTADMLTQDEMRDIFSKSSSSDLDQEVDFESFLQVNQKMILNLTASIMYWSLQQKAGESEQPSPTESNDMKPYPTTRTNVC